MQKINTVSMSVEKKISLSNIYILILFLFPIFTLLQSTEMFSYINKIFFALLMGIQVVFLIKSRFSILRVFLYLSLLFVHLYSILVTSFPLYNSNVLFYLLFFVFYTFYIIDNKEHIVDIIKTNNYMILISILLWTIIVGISIFIPNSYVRNNDWGSGTYFASIAQDPFRLVPTALLILTLVYIEFCCIKKNKFLSIAFSIVPLYSFFMSGARTYFIVGILVFLLIWYNLFEKKKYFYISLIPLAIIFNMVRGRGQFNFLNMNFLYKTTIIEQSFSFPAT